MYTTYVDERDFCFVLLYKCDFTHQTVVVLFISASSESDKSIHPTMWLCFVFDPVLFYSTLFFLSPGQYESCFPSV